MKILIIDDESLICRSFHKIAQSRGYESDYALDGISGLEKWRHQNPDLVFLDVLMPGLSGPEVLRERGETQAKVILMSAYTGDFSLEKVRNLGADLFISKPFDDIFKVFDQGIALLRFSPNG